VAQPGPRSGAGRESALQAQQAVSKLQAELTHVARVTTMGELAASIAHEQNVVEHSAILCDDPLLKIPPELMVERMAGANHASRLEMTLHNSEQQLIEKALQEAAGRVSGPSGAAARLGVPASTLESKIKRFKIDKFRYRVGND